MYKRQETEDFDLEFIKRIIVDLMRLGEAVRLMSMKLKRRGTTWPTPREAGQLPEPTFRAGDSDVDLTSYMRTQRSGKNRNEGETSLPDRVEAIMRMIFTWQRWRETRSRRWEAKRCTGWKRMKATVPTLEGGR